MAILLLCCLLQPVFAIDKLHPNHNVGFFIEGFGGRVDPATLPHVYEVFAKVCTVAEIHNRNLPQLVVIKDLPGPPALVLADGNIVLAQRALDVIYDNVPIWHGNARMAFVIGHELAHLANDDFWNAEVRSLVQSKAFSGEVGDLMSEQIEKEDQADLIEKEFKADDRGFLYAAMAGFPVHLLLAPESDFLSHWVAGTYTQSSKTHPKAIERTNLLRMRLQEKKDRLEFFYMGVRLASLGRYLDAVYFFSEFQKVFPGREVFNNLGVCYLQMAIKKMPPSLAYEYWFPSILDNETVIQTFRDSNQMEIAKGFLEQAVHYLAIATEKDPEYSIGYINLAVAYFYLDEIYKARAAIEEARRLKPDDYEIESLRALILFEEGQPMDTWSYAEEIFSALADNHPADSLPLFVYYNWARLLELRGRSAEKQWKKLTKHRCELPQSIARMLCEQLKNLSDEEDCLKAIDKPNVKSVPEFLESLPIQPGFDTWQLEQTEHPLKSWKQLPFHWRGEAANSGIIYQSRQGDVVLEMDDVVEMVVMQQNFGQSEKLLQECGPPHHKKTVMNGELWSYGHWFVLLEHNKIKEFWIVTEKLY